MFAMLLLMVAAEPNPILPEGAKLEKLYTRTRAVKGGLTEGPAVAPDGSIYFTDITQGKEPSEILRYDPKTGKTAVFIDDARKANGLMFDPEGRLVACEGADVGGRAVVRYDVKTKKRTVLTDNYKGKKYNAPNDLVIDTKGRIFFTDPRYGGTEPRELEHRAVYRIDTDGTVTQITTVTEKPNGIILSPDGKTLYVADHNNGSDGIVAGEKAVPGAMNILAFDLDEKGNVGKPRVLYDFGKGPGCDGMTVDVKGNIYLTLRDPWSRTGAPGRQQGVLRGGGQLQHHAAGDGREGGPGEGGEPAGDEGAGDLHGQRGLPLADRAPPARRDAAPVGGAPH
jgi:gluconolactonase